jgi:hypothetical protein
MLPDNVFVGRRGAHFGTDGRIGPTPGEEDFVGA